MAPRDCTLWGSLPQYTRVGLCNQKVYGRRNVMSHLKWGWKKCCSSLSLITQGESKLLCCEKLSGQAQRVGSCSLLAAVLWGRMDVPSGLRQPSGDWGSMQQSTGNCIKNPKLGQPEKVWNSELMRVCWSQSQGLGVTCYRATGNRW